MVPQNEFRAFATGPNAIIQTQEDYEKSTALKEGFRKGLARSSEVNKALRQASSIAAAVAGFTADKSGEDILDNGDIGTIQQHFETAIRTISSTLAAEAGGTADELTATFTPTLKQLEAGKTVLIRATEKNRSKTPRFQADATDARPIVKGNNLPLEEGDIAGSGHWLELQYDQALDKWVLQNPAKGISPQNGVPVGTIEYFARETVPQGYLMATGQDVGRDTCPDLFAAIGTRYGEGDGETTFNLPNLNKELGAIVPFASLHMPSEYLMCDGRAISRTDYADLFAVIGTTCGEGDGTSTFNLPDLINRFAQGSNTPGLKVEAGLPNIKGEFERVTSDTPAFFNGAFEIASNNLSLGGDSRAINARRCSFDASRSNPLYGASDTVQPPALTVCYGIRAKNTLQAAIKAFDTTTHPGLIDITELANDIRRAKTPLGTIAWFAMTAPPAGYLIANGAAVSRTTCPDLFAAIGTTFGEGDGKTTFNLPDLIDRFAQGSTTPGQKVEAGVPNIEGTVTNIMVGTTYLGTGAFTTTAEGISPTYGGTTSAAVRFNFSADKSNSIYGASDTVQPPALTLLPCIKAFDAATHPGLIDMTGLANDVNKKLDRVIDNKPVRYVIDACNDGTNWYRKWSDGWLEQGGTIESKLSGTASLLVPFATANYIIVASQQVTQNIDSRAVVKTKPDTATTFLLEATSISSVAVQQVLTCNYYASGQGVLS